MTLRPLEPDLVYTSVGKWGLEQYVFVLFQVKPLSYVKESGFLFAKKRRFFHGSVFKKIKIWRK